MKRIAWLTDIHLNFVAADRLTSFFEQVRASEAEAILLGGDIAEATDVIDYLEQIDAALARPVYFVLGNHDFYFGSIQEVRRQASQLCREQPNLHYLTESEPIELTPGVGLVGHDGWADARIGDYERSLVMMNDYKLITELAGVGKQDRWPLLKALGDEAAEHLRRVLPVALDRWEQVFLLTHVPPLREACWHEGQLSDDEWAPHFTCKAVGDAILEIARDYPQRKLTVLCGHTHSSGEAHPAENVTILTGGADYGKPDVTRVFEVG